VKAGLHPLSCYLITCDTCNPVACDNPVKMDRGTGVYSSEGCLGHVAWSDSGHARDPTLQLG
jgi:hypothetical protein